MDLAVVNPMALSLLISVLMLAVMVYVIYEVENGKAIEGVLVSLYLRRE